MASQKGSEKEWPKKEIGSSPRLGTLLEKKGARSLEGNPKKGD